MLSKVNIWVNKNLNIMLIGLFICYILVSKFELTLTTKQSSTTLKFTGIVWVALDYYLIVKYHSNDIPMQVLSITKTTR